MNTAGQLLQVASCKGPQVLLKMVGEDRMPECMVRGTGGATSEDILTLIMRTLNVIMTMRQRTVVSHPVQ